MPIEGIIEKIHIEIYYFIISNIYHTHLCTHTLYILALFTTEAQEQWCASKRSTSGVAEPGMML